MSYKSNTEDSSSHPYIAQMNDICIRFYGSSRTAFLPFGEVRRGSWGGQEELPFTLNMNKNIQPFGG